MEYTVLRFSNTNAGKRNWCAAAQTGYGRLPFQLTFNLDLRNFKGSDDGGPVGVGS